MPTNEALRLALIGVVAGGIGLGVALGLRSLASGNEGAGERPLAAKIQTRQSNGEVHLILSADALAAADIRIEKTRSITFQESAYALGTVISPQTLADQRRAYQTAAAEAARGELASKAAEAEVQRLQPLHRDSRIVSDKALQTAQVAASTEATNLSLAVGQLSLQKATLNQQWGPAVAGWLKDGSPDLDRLLSGQALLVQIALPAGQHVDHPGKARLELSSGEMLDATILSSVPQADPRFQAQSFYAIAPADPRLLPGMSVTASVLVGAPVTGIEVPDTAVVRWQGKPFIFAEVAPGEFARQPIATDVATPNGWLVREGLSAGTGIAVRGAQLLLSEQLQAQPTVGTKQ